jgi:hypothetical protein
LSNSVTRIVSNNLSNIPTAEVEVKAVLDSSGLANGAVCRIGNESWVDMNTSDFAHELADFEE